MRRQPRRLFGAEPAGTCGLIAQAAGERQPGQAVQPLALGERSAFHLRHRLQHAAGTRRHALRRGPRCAQQSRCQCRLALVETIRPLAEQPAAHRRNTNHLATETGEIEVGLKNLVLLPALLQPQRARRLREFFRYVAPAMTR